MGLTNSTPYDIIKTIQEREVEKNGKEECL